MPSVTDPIAVFIEVACVPRQSYHGSGTLEHAERVLALAADRAELTAPILSGQGDLLAEVVYAVRHEQARSLSDVLMRRTRLGILDGRALTDPARPEALHVAEVISGELAWSQDRVAEEVAGFREEASFLGAVAGP